LYETGKRVLKGHVGVIDVTSPITVADTDHLLLQAKELQKEEERLKTTFPSATKVMDPDDCQSTSSDGKTTHSHGTGDESESSGVLVDKDDFASSREDLVIEETPRGIGKIIESAPAIPSEGIIGKSE
jgi:hypothetical protein